MQWEGLAPILFIFGINHSEPSSWKIVVIAWQTVNVCFLSIMYPRNIDISLKSRNFGNSTFIILICRSFQMTSSYTRILDIQSDTKKRELLKNPTKIEEIQEKKIIDRNWNITTCLLRDSNPNYQCLKITSCRWRPPPRMHSFTVTTHFKSSRSFVSPCVCVACSAECDSVAF